MKSTEEYQAIKEFAKTIVREWQQDDCLFEEQVEHLICEFLDNNEYSFLEKDSIILSLSANPDSENSNYCVSRIVDDHPLESAAEKLMYIWNHPFIFNIIDQLYSELKKQEGTVMPILESDDRQEDGTFQDETGKWRIVFQDIKLSYEFDTEDEAKKALKNLKVVNEDGNLDV